SLENLFSRLGRSPAAFARNFIPGKSDRDLEGFYHRFNSAADLGALLHLLGQMLRGWGSIEGFWAAVNANAAPDGIAARAGRFMKGALTLDLENYFPRRPDEEEEAARVRQGFRYLLPNADGASACKRLNMFLRWVARP